MLKPLQQQGILQEEPNTCSKVVLHFRKQVQWADNQFLDAYDCFTKLFFLYSNQALSAR
jgi:hypothetical protein